ncbi:hypothetical protein [Burkholderia anthina]|uniref:hypothetical protein n=1 Tax=Burkholderia anthina TaxID=179879 RepID=UPI00158DB4BB|nr:hypothetical protein [Burkholderia anthina]
MRPSRPPALAALAARLERPRDAFARAPAPPLAIRVFSHRPPVFHQARRSGTALFHPPYGKTFDLLPCAPTRIACPVDHRETLS